MASDAFYMRRCLKLAEKARGKTSPNPMVGCVIVKKGRVISKGYHLKAGKPHAEAVAIAGVRTKSGLIGSTLYVNLEPCVHEGKTPPCVDLIIRHQIKKVVIGSKDPNSLVNGGGIKKLRDAGVSVKVGVLERECRRLNSRFITFHEEKRPYVILKWARTKNNVIGISGAKLSVSSAVSRKISHLWRSQEDAILVGAETALNDNPKLNTRLVKGKSPVKILIDPKARVPKNSRMFATGGRCLVYSCKKSMKAKGATYIYVIKGPDILKQVLKNLQAKGIQSVIVEGGAKTLTEFIKGGLWDEARIFTAEKKVQGRKGLVKGPKFPFRSATRKRSGTDQLQIFYRV